jgi:Zn-dependent protease
MRSFFRQGMLLGLVMFVLLANVILFVFNLIPALPMDGGRILRSILALFVPYRHATKVTLVVGQLTAILLVLLAIYFGSAGLFLVAIFVFIAGRPVKV